MIDAEIERQHFQQNYDETHSQLERNIKGQFATPYGLALSITKDALGRMPGATTLLEPSCGSGAFVSAAKSLNPELKIAAVEKDPTVWREAETLWADASTAVSNADFFDCAASLGRFDLLVTNPPYSRHHHLSSEEKQHYGSVAEEFAGRHLSQLAGLHAYFILVGTHMLNPGGIASWLVPAELFSVNYGKTIRAFVTSDVTVERIHFFENDDLQFDDALVSSCVLVLRNKKASDDDLAMITRGDFDHPAQTMQITICELSKRNRWQHLFKETSFTSETRIGDYFKVKRGLSTGAESFYAKSRDEWHELGIGDEWLMPVLPAPRYMHELVVDSDEAGWPTRDQRALLNIPYSYDEDDLPDALQAYLAGCPDKVRNSYTAKHRKKWFAIEQREPAPIVCTYMSRSDEQPFRFVRNRSQAVVTTAYLCLYPKAEVSNEQLDSICDALNAIEPDTLIASGREYGGGLRKLEPKELLSVPLSM